MYDDNCMRLQRTDLHQDSGCTIRVQRLIVGIGLTLLVSTLLAEFDAKLWDRLGPVNFVVLPIDEAAIGMVIREGVIQWA